MLSHDIFNAERGLADYKETVRGGIRMFNIAHRGGAGLRPENTSAAFETAIARGYDGAELDVQLTADGVAVVHHDLCLNPALARKDGAWLAGEGPRIRDLSFAELENYDVGRPDPASDYARTGPAFQPEDGARVPRLADIVAMASAARRPFFLFVELKSALSGSGAESAALADAALGIVADADFLDRAIFVGFDWRGLMRVKTQAPAARCWFSTDRMEGDLTPVLDHIAAFRGDGWFSCHENATPENVAQARARGLKVGAWTVNTPADMRRLMNLDAICTDRPDLLQALE